MFARLGCLFVVVPLLELALLVQVGRWIGVLPTVGLVAVTGLVGAWIARNQGLRTLADLQLRVARGEIPADALLDAASILVGGLLLLTPGVLSDALGFALLLPVTRRPLQQRVLEGLMRRVRQGQVQVTWMGMGPMGPKGPGQVDPEDPPPRPGEIIQRPEGDQVP